MTSHSSFLELAAAAIDFRLSPSERRDLEHHLGDCHACARTIAAIRGDATAMAHLPPVVLPERRGLEILDSVLRPATNRHELGDSKRGQTSGSHQGNGKRANHSRPQSESDSRCSGCRWATPALRYCAE